MIRMVGMFNVETGNSRLYGHGGFAGATAIKNGIVSGQLNAVLDGKSFTGTCIAAKIVPGVADLVFAGKLGPDAATITIHLDVASKTLFALVEFAGVSVVSVNEDTPAAFPVWIEAEDVDKVWEYIRVLIH